ncbi:hypothetical protein Bhyg_13655 [Pseudolycoriella hygida]|uniref:Uncharacterized protein n=1 Tax=Pseudolycoriella hygida TaxID=35572 RepID=A0A9Q0MNH5_9DIPT|nr:hypothetical protein Bhyg_13655 [Pseudolycoriella hygida]
MVNGVNKLTVVKENLPLAEREKTKRLQRAYNRKKLAEFRERKKEKDGLVVPVSAEGNRPDQTTKQASDGSYKTSNALFKAVTKAKKALPVAPAKKKLVVSKILNSFNTEDRQDIVSSNMPKAKPTKGITSDVVMLIQDFYERDDISRMSPNARDCRKFFNTSGEKEVKQIRHLMYKLTDAYDLFVKDFQKGKFV